MATMRRLPDQIFLSLRYYWRLKSKLDTDTTPAQKMQRFETALSRILTVSKDELNRRIVKDEEMGGWPTLRFADTKRVPHPSRFLRRVGTRTATTRLAIMRLSIIDNLCQSPLP